MSAGWRLDAEHPFGSAEPVRRYLLANGMRVILLADHSAPVVSLQTWYRVGSRHEAPGRTGMAHLFEHLMFTQTRSLAPGELDRLIERTGGDTNAATWTDWTFYRVSVPVRHLELALRLEADRMQHLVLEAEQVESEREVVANERLERVDDDVDGFLDEELFRLAFTRHPYRWPTIGWMNDIRAMTRPDIQRFYETFYAPNNASLVIVGDVDEAGALELVDRHYGEIAPADIPAETSEREPAQTGERRARFEKPVAADRVVFGYRTPGQGHPDWAVLELLSNLLTGSPSARLHRRLVVEEQTASAVDGILMPFRDPGLLQLSVNLRRGHRAADAERAVDEEIARLAAEPLSAAELARVKNRVETDFWSELSTFDGKAEALGHFESTLDDFHGLFRTAEALGAVTAADITRATHEYLDVAQRSVVVVEPEGEG